MRLSIKVCVVCVWCMHMSAQVHMSVGVHEETEEDARVFSFTFCFLETDLSVSGSLPFQLVLPSNAGVKGMLSHAELFSWKFEFCSLCLQCFLPTRPSSQFLKFFI